MAGGKSLRLGRDKALETINKRSLIERAVECLCSVSNEVLVVTSQEQLGLIGSARLKAKVIVDLYPGRGALGGIHTGLMNSATFHSLVVACDMPFLNRDLLCYLIGLAPNFDAVVPEFDDMTEPLHAVYSKNCLSPVEQLLRQDSLRISGLFCLVKTKYVGEDEIAKFDPEHLAFLNVNTRNDLERVKVLMRHREQLTTVRRDKSIGD